MASLLELAQIVDNSTMDPGEPPDPDIQNAHNLRKRIRMLLVKRAVTFLRNSPNPPQNQEQNEQIALAQQVLRAPGHYAEGILNIVLAMAPSAATPDAILATTDAQLETALLNSDLALLARGLTLGR